MAVNPRVSTPQLGAQHPATAGVRPHTRGATGPYSRALDRGAVGGLNGNTTEAKFIKAYEAMLVEHCGGSPSIIERALITRAARLACHLELWDQRTIPQGGAFSATGHNHYIAWSNSLSRTLARLGLKPAAAKPPNLAEHLAELAARGNVAA